MEKRAFFIFVSFISLLLLGCTVMPECVVSPMWCKIPAGCTTAVQGDRCILVPDTCKLPEGCNITKRGVAMVTTTFNLTNITAGLGEPCPESKSCVAFFCKNKTIPFLSFIEFSLKGGKCYFSNITEAEFTNWTNDQPVVGWENNTNIRPFMIGQGPSGVDFQSANLFCNNSLKMAVRWLIGRNGEAPPLPDRRVAACFLDMNVIPVFVMYTNGTNISNESAANISAELDEVIPRLGPVLVSAEINYNGSNPDAVKNVALQLKAIKEKCPYCFTILSPKNLDKEGLEKVYNYTRDNGINFNATVDMIGQGIIANDYNDTCDPQAVVAKNIAFSRYVLATYQKPTIWLYYGISNGSNSAKTCTWTAEAIAESYNFLLSNIPALAHAGILGVAPYEFTDVPDDPIPCTAGACDFGLVDASGTQKHPQLNAWSEACKAYYLEGGFAPIVFPSEGTGFKCSFAVDTTMEKWGTVSIGGASAFSSEKVSPADTLYICEECIASEIPSEFMGDACSLNADTGNSETDDCLRKHEIDACADSYGVDRQLLRAIVKHDEAWDDFSCSEPMSWTTGKLTVKEFREYLDKASEIVAADNEKFGVEGNETMERLMSAFVGVTRLGVIDDNSWHTYINDFDGSDFFPDYVNDVKDNPYPKNVFSCWNEFLDPEDEYKSCKNMCDTMEKAAGELKGPGEECESGDECWSGHCIDGKCDCLPSDEDCTYGFECCSESCVNSKCTG